MKYFLIILISVVCLAPMPHKNKKKKKNKETKSLSHCGFCMGVLREKFCGFCGNTKDTVFMETRDECEPD